MIRITKQKLLFSILLLMAGGSMALWWVAQSTDEQMRAELLQQARISAQAISVDKITSLSGSKKDLGTAAYQRIKSQLASMRKAGYKCKFLYLMGRLSDGNVFFFVDSLPPDSEDYATPGLVYDEVPKSYLHAFDTRQESVVGPVTDRWGTLITALIPITSPDSDRLLAVLGMDVDASDWNQETIRRCIGPSLVTLVLVLLILLLASREKILTELHRSEEKHRSIVENATNLFYSHTADHELTYISPQCRKFLQCEQEEAMIQWPEFATDNPINKKGFELTQKAIDSGKSQKPYELELEGKQGKKIIVEVNETPVLNNGKTTAIVGSLTDITERKQAEAEREKLQTQLNQARKMESVGILAGGIAHNFNNILMGVQGRTSLMMMGKDTSDLDYEHLKEIEEYVRNAVELTRDLLGFARGGKYEVKPTDLNALIKHENRMFGRTKKEVRVQGEYEKDLWTVDVDRGQLRQALLNLYVNASQAMPGGGDLCIRTENVTLDEEYIKPFAFARGRYVKVSVTDTGVGMDAATRGKIFDPFFTTRDVGQGSGLGLASVYGIIKNHGGFINVYSEKGEGTTFNIYLPASEKEIAKGALLPDRHEIQYGQGTVLLVDDEVMIIKVGQEMLEMLGYRVLTAGSGREALDLYEKQKDAIDLVILDMIMPDMGGGETFDRLKAIDGNVRVLLSSGYSINGQAKEILDRGCIGFIQKPFSIKALAAKVKAVLDEGKSDAQQ